MCDTHKASRALSTLSWLPASLFGPILGSSWSRELSAACCLKSLLCDHLFNYLVITYQPSNVAMQLGSKETRRNGMRLKTHYVAYYFQQENCFHYGNSFVNCFRGLHFMCQILKSYGSDSPRKYFLTLLCSWRYLIFTSDVIHLLKIQQQ